MKTILQTNWSLFSSEGQSSRLADEYVAALAARNPGLKLIRRDLARNPVPHLDGERFGAFLAISEASRKAALTGARDEIGRLAPALQAAA